MNTIIKMIAFDVEGTLVEGKIWPKLNSLAGVTPEEDKKWFFDYHDGKISFSQWDKLISAKYRKNKVLRNDILKLSSQIIFLPDVKDTLEQLKNKYPLCLISSAIDTYIKNVAKILEIDKYHANYSFIFDKYGYVKDILYEAPDEKAKVLFLKRICAERKLKPQEIAFVGDSINDLEAFRFTKRGILVGSESGKLEKASWKRISSIKELLGIFA